MVGWRRGGKGEGRGKLLALIRALDWDILLAEDQGEQQDGNALMYEKYHVSKQVQSLCSP